MFRTLRHWSARFGRWPRLALAGACVLLAANSAVAARGSSTAQPSGMVLVAARDLPAGRLLTAADVRVVRWPAQLRPRRARASPRAVVGQRLAGAVTSGEPITAARLLGAGLTTGLDPRLLAVPLTVNGSRLAELVHVGDRVDLLAVPRDVGDPAVGTGSMPTDPSGSAGNAGPTVVGSRLRVLSVLRGADGGGTDLVVAADRATALRTTRVSVSQGLAAVIDPP